MLIPKEVNGHTRIFHGVFESLACINMAYSHMRVLLVILRKTYGFGKPKDAISLSQFVQMTGMTRNNVCQSINALKEMNIISLHRETGKITKYSYNKHSATWKVVSKQRQSPNREQGSLYIENQAVSKQRQTKDTITKETITKDKEQYLEFVYLKTTEYEKLITRFGKSKTDNYIQRLNNYIGSTGKKYKSHYHTILSWSDKEPKPITKEIIS